MPPGEFLEAIQGLPLLGTFALLLRLLLLALSLALQLIVIARVLHLELVKLTLGAVTVAAALLLLALLTGLLARYAELILAQLLQMLQGGLFVDDRVGERLANRFAAGVFRLGETVCRSLHRLIGLIRLTTGLGVLQ